MALRGKNLVNREVGEGKGNGDVGGNEKLVEKTARRRFLHRIVVTLLDEILEE